MATVSSWVEKIDKVLFLWVGSFAINIITFLFIHYKIHPSNRTLALHYNVIVGVDWYGAGKNLYSLPLIAFLLTVINMILYNALKRRQYILPFLSAIITFIVQLLILISVFFLARVN